MLRWIRPSRGPRRPRRAANDHRRARLWVEPLETRTLLSADLVLHTLAQSNDPYYTYGYLWGTYGDSSPLRINQYGSQAAEAWAGNHTGSKSVYVGVLDEGIQVLHPDLKANVWTNPYDPVDGIDNDGNGYRDDTNGWDFYYNNRTVYDGGSWGWQDAHGTHVAGTIGAVGGNGLGVAGVNWDVTLISAKFLGPYGGSISNAARAIDYLTDLKLRHGLNIVAINASWGGGGYSQALYNALSRANDAGILFVAAAGNNGVNTDSTKFYPAGYNLPNVISVAAISSSGGLASWSNYGATSVDLGAPGVSIYSTLPSNRYGAYSGTSMAAPHVTGAAALYKSVYPGATAAEIKNAILSSASLTPTTSLAGRTATGGRLDVAAMLAIPPVGASSPGGTGGDGSSGGSSGTSGASAQGTSDAPTDDPGDPGPVAIFFLAPPSVVPLRQVVVSAPLVSVPAPPPVVFVPSGEGELPILRRVVGGVGVGVREEEPGEGEQPRVPAEQQQQAPQDPQAPAGMGAAAKEALFTAWGRAWGGVFASDESIPQSASEEASLALVGPDAGTVAPLGAAAGIVLALGGGWMEPAGAARPERRRRSAR
ncbi:MAG: S8 family serine peptidase [Gemmataceae bacterium]|nr:S8 family serine peptidase [Gemmataceae bacterium]